MKLLKDDLAEIVQSLVVAVVCVAVLISLHVAGKRARIFASSAASGAPTVHLARTTADLSGYWKRLGLKGRVVVHAGRYLHYVVPEVTGGFQANDRYPLTVSSRRRQHEAGLDHRNFLWNAVQTNVARKLYTVLPQESFRQRFAGGNNDVRVQNGEVRSHDLGTPRVITTEFPRLDEPVVLNVDASYLSGSTGPELLRSLLASKPPADLVTVCLSEDNPDVLPAERSRVLELLRKMAASGDIRLVELSPAQSGGV